MALEQLLTTLIASLDANTAALKGAKGATTAASGGTATKPPATTKPASPTIDFDALKVIAGKVMDKHGKPFAKKLIQDVGAAKDLATVKPEKYAALVKAFDASMAEEAETATEAEDDEL